MKIIVMQVKSEKLKLSIRNLSGEIVCSLRNSPRAVCSKFSDVKSLRAKTLEVFFIGNLPEMTSGISGAIQDA